jgi:dTDP-3-amino-3,4,6-trideoxy-alpha-D-glucose transaminase
VNVSFLDLSRSVYALRAELDRAVAGVLDEGRFVLGPTVESFERAWSEATGAAHAVAVASGTDALALALRAAGVSLGDEVITAANTCVPTVAAIEAAGAAPVLADVDERTWTIDAGQVADVIGPRTRAVVPVHLYGRPAEHDVYAVADEHDVRVVEDAAQAHGAPRGSGVAAAYSFYPTKNLGSLGDGGALVTDDEWLADRARRLRVYGEEEQYRSVEPGVNSRLDALQAAVLNAKLPYLERWNRRRRELAEYYLEALAGCTLRLPADSPDHVWHLFVVRSDDRDSFRRELAERGIETAVHYPRAVHEHPAYAHLGRMGGFAVAEALAREVVSLPLYPELKDTEAEAVAGAVREVARARL